LADNKDYERSKALCLESLELNLELGDRRGVAVSLVGLAGIALAQGYIVHAAQLPGAAEKLLKDTVAHLLSSDQLEYERHMTSVRTRLGIPTFNRAWAEGQSMTLEQIIAYVLEDLTTPIESTQPRQTANQMLPDPLTNRELEILRLIANGFSNRDIAAELIFSLGTVKWYVHQIHTKLGVGNRTLAVARARELRLLP
jgi:DNA-binding NarL/FixJ family response regulator